MYLAKEPPNPPPPPPGFSKPAPSPQPQRPKLTTQPRSAKPPHLKKKEFDALVAARKKGTAAAVFLEQKHADDDNREEEEEENWVWGASERLVVESEAEDERAANETLPREEWIWKVLRRKW
jgi:hypothetical protein